MIEAVLIFFVGFVIGGLSVAYMAAQSRARRERDYEDLLHQQDSIIKRQKLHIEKLLTSPEGV